MSEPLGSGLGTGAQDSTESLVDWTVWMPIVLSKSAIAGNSAFRGHQETWNDQLSSVGNYDGIRNGVD